jgi:diguanylate cyclase (GGDEF)-like protein
MRNRRFLYLEQEAKMFEQRPVATPAQGLLEEAAGDALLVVNPATRGLLYVNAGAARLFALREDELLARDADDLLIEFADMTPRRFLAPAGQRGGEAQEVEVTIEPLRAGTFVRAGAMLVTIRPRRAPEEPPRSASVERLESLWAFVVRNGFDDAEHAAAILREGARGLGCESGTLARIEGSESVTEFASNDVRNPLGLREPLDRIVGSIALRLERAVAIPDVKEHLESARNPAAIAEGLRSYVAAPFRVGDAQWLLTLASTQPRPGVYGPDDLRYVEFLVDAFARIVRRRDSEAHIKALAFSDALTSLPNRAALFERLDEALAAAERHRRRCAVMFLDVDGFKAVNDTVGHHAGDKVLAEMAQRLRGTLRREEYIGRLGGDEFAIILPQVSAREEIEQVAQRIGQVLAFPFVVDHYRFALSASIGVAIYPNDASTRDSLLACADAAMYSAKEAGRARIHFHDELSADELAAPALGRGGELSFDPFDIGYLLCYQPVLDFKTDGVLSAEALIRRVHPYHGLLAPERILTSVRDAAARRALDRWVIREAATQTRAWHIAGKSLRVEVNLASFDPGEFEELLADETHTIDFSRICLEVPAHLLRGDGVALMRFLELCRSRRITISLDNFEGGLGLMQALAPYPIETLKLERNLVESLTQSRTAQAVVEGTVLVARALGWRVIAKGVETAAQREMLAALGCDGIQGFIVAHPMTALDFGNWLNLHRIGTPPE